MSFLLLSDASAGHRAAVMKDWYPRFSPRLETGQLSCRLGCTSHAGRYRGEGVSLKGLFQCLGTDTDRKDLNHVQEPWEEELTLVLVPLGT